MPNIVFTKGLSTFGFSKGRAFPVEDPGQVNVPTGLTDGGQMYAYDKGIAEKLYNLAFENLVKADFDSVEDWIINVSVGPKNTFTYTDEAGVTHTVRCLDTRNPLREVSSGRYAGTIRLREEI
jgi:hypothetical protein